MISLETAVLTTDQLYVEHDDVVIWLWHCSLLDNLLTTEA